jgi:hypothetical protein
VPSYKITIIRISGKPESGIRYTDLIDKEKIQAIVREKLRKIGTLDTLAFILVEKSNLPAKKDL